MDISRKWLSDYVALNCDDAYLCDMMYRMYANPVLNQQKALGK